LPFTSVRAYDQESPFDASTTSATRIKTMATSGRPRWFHKMIPAAIAFSLVAMLVALLIPAVLDARRAARASTTL
jgi:hypothetical protein